jgi:hypothetical protein
MNLLESVRLALGALAANKLRSVLTMLGVIIGVGAVISLMSIGTGVQKQVTDQIKGMGSNLLFITPGAQTQGGVRTQAGTAPSLTDEDAEAIINSGRVPQAVAVAPEAGGGGQVVANGTNTFSRVLGVTPAYESVRNFKVSVSASPSAAPSGASAASRAGSTLFSSAPVSAVVSAVSASEPSPSSLAASAATSLAGAAAAAAPATRLPEAERVRRFTAGASSVGVAALLNCRTKRSTASVGCAPLRFHSSYLVTSTWIVAGSVRGL